mgnify:CR=1 FL=1
MEGDLRRMGIVEDVRGFSNFCGRQWIIALTKREVGGGGCERDGMNFFSLRAIEGWEKG